MAAYILYFKNWKMRLSSNMAQSKPTHRMQLSNVCLAIQLGFSGWCWGADRHERHKKEIFFDFDRLFKLLINQRANKGLDSYNQQQKKWLLRRSFTEQVDCRYAWLIKYHFVEFVQVFWTAASPLPPAVSGIKGNFWPEAAVCLATRKELGDEIIFMQPYSSAEHFLLCLLCTLFIKSWRCSCCTGVLTHRECSLCLSPNIYKKPAKIKKRDASQIHQDCSTSAFPPRRVLTCWGFYAHCFK